ncbi:MAG TPA: peroxidase-related enzyme [Flavisolibacter sp.]|nr:peroxidase-related enzyme [Flavisolibacter sp.]
MAYINTGSSQPGIIGLMEFSPKTARALNSLAQSILRSSSSLMDYERELIATYVSHLNNCRFCTASHAAVVDAMTESGSLSRQVRTDMENAEISEKLKALLRLAGKVQQSGSLVTIHDIEAARTSGADDTEIHDTVLIAAAFCMFNRYVDGLGTSAAEVTEYAMIGDMLAKRGYVAAEIEAVV